MGTQVATESPRGLDRLLCCAALGIAVAGHVLLRPSDTLGLRLLVCTAATALGAAAFAAPRRTGLARTGAWLAVVDGFAGVVAHVVRCHGALAGRAPAVAVGRDPRRVRSAPARRPWGRDTVCGALDPALSAARARKPSSMVSTSWHALARGAST